MKKWCENKANNQLMKASERNNVNERENINVINENERENIWRRENESQWKEISKINNVSEYRRRKQSMSEKRNNMKPGNVWKAMKMAKII